ARAKEVTRVPIGLIDARGKAKKVSLVPRGMPVAPDQAASAFPVVQLRAPSAWVTSQSVQKVKEQPSSRLVLCLSPMNGRPPLFYLPPAACSAST
ncbi:hypothetical protein, partial [Bacillus sp. FJAT-27251]|uniref:hypothetical protein n=1 Tax=Bacillus sp. FJAT-27251 TaxID=1684142 RepID=UPI001E476ADF